MVTKTVNRIYSDFDLSFTANPVTGDLAKKTDANAVKQSIKNLVLTRFYERPFQPRLGSPIYGLLFDTIDVISANRLQIELEILIQKYEPRAILHSIDVIPDLDNNAFRVDIVFEAIAVPGPITFSTIIRRSR